MAVAVRVCVWYRVKVSSRECVSGTGWKDSRCKSVTGTGSNGSSSESV